MEEVGSPENVSGWHFGRFCLARPATICWFVTVSESISWLPVISFKGVEDVSGCQLKMVFCGTTRSSSVDCCWGRSGFRMWSSGRKSVFSDFLSLGVGCNGSFICSGVLSGSWFCLEHDTFPMGRGLKCTNCEVRSSASILGTSNVEEPPRKL